MQILSNDTLWAAHMGILWSHSPRGGLGVSSKSATSHAGVASDPGRWEGYTHRLVQVVFGIQTRDPLPTGGYSTPIDFLDVLESPTPTPHLACEHPRTYGGPSTYWTALPQRARRKAGYRATSGRPAGVWPAITVGHAPARCQTTSASRLCARVPANALPRKLHCSLPDRCVDDGA